MDAGLATQLVNDEKLGEALVMILVANEMVDCELIPTLCSLMKIATSNN